ncbi:MAG TPA: molybdopterin-dependent oxidoreductase [Candidatus Limnocylindria bacterium]|nr:molybdopterin-dependent oxidoreductase [Candidatus Limnocylindria bacterium]
MSDSVVYTRRDFLKLVGIGAAGAASGCAPPQAEKLIPYLVAPNDVLPGIPYWYASTCTECPAGCGILVKQREGRAIKIEGNPAHPVNRGGLCARGQAGLQGLYDPDRLKGPMVREGGAWKPVAWDQALRLATEKLAPARGKVALVTSHATGSFHALCGEWATAAGGTHLVYEAFAHESMREANRRTFGQASVPRLDFERATFLIAFGADFLETWLSPVGHARGFATMRARRDGGAFVAVEPRLSLTGANADEWIAIRPGGEMALALGMARTIVTEGLGAAGGSGAAMDALSAYTPEAVEQQTGVPGATVQRLARAFAARRPSLAVAGGIAAQSEQSVALHAAVNLLNHVAGNLGETVHFDRTLNLDAVAPFGEVQNLIAAMGEGRVDALVVHGANPAYAVPAWAGFVPAMDKVPFKISLSSVLDETAEHCDLLLPSTHALESLGDAEPLRGVYAILQPAMQPVPLFDAKPAGDMLIALARGAGFGQSFPDGWRPYLEARWRPLHGRFGGGRDFETFWRETLQKGGVWEEESAATPARWTGAPVFASPELKGTGELALVLYPSPALYDGRGANKPWLQELPDPTTKAVWGSWAEIHPDTAAKLGVRNGQPIKIATEAGSVELPAYVYGGIRPDTVAIPLGQGHTAYGRYAKGCGVNPLSLLSAATDAASGAVAYLSAKATVTVGAQAMDLVVTQREKIQSERVVAEVIPLAALAASAAVPGVSHAGSHDDSLAASAVADSMHGGNADTSHRAPAHRAAHAASGHAPASGAAHHPVHPSQTRPGKYTEPMARPPDYRPPAHAVTAFESEHPARSGRQNPVTEGHYKHAKHRWAMAIDLNSCTGCSACLVACHAENNVPMVGPEPIKRGREMHWIRIERYERKLDGGENDVRFMPMMCQHCGDAPCETVCPVYATYHNPEGLNAQVYNRCVGTRYCSNNCPYKVRAFNFFDYAAPEKPTFAFPEPLNWQLNPDVTVRSKGVMEKCTMCVQRILEGKGNAKDEQRALRDGEIQTACAQTCPTQAIVFGDLVDPESAVSKASHGERRYWVLGDLNTKPGVTYLKKVQRPVEPV